MAALDSKLAPSREDIGEARATIAGLVHRTPLLSSRSVGERAGSKVWLKAENLQKTGSFKARGAFNKVLHLSPAERERGIVTASAGNHGGAVAFVARHLSIPGFVVMPEKANASKVAAVRAYGATAILHGEAWDDAFARSMELADQKGLTYVHPFKDRMVMAGQATIALEIAEDLPEVTTVVVPIGGGGLISGIGTAFALHHPSVRVIGVEAEGSPNMERSRREGRAITLPRVDTIADGLATRSTDPEVFEIVERVVHDLVTVTDDEIREAILFLLERAKLLAEPAGAAAVAALIKGKISLPKDASCVALVCGGNFDVAGKLTLRV